MRILVIMFLVFYLLLFLFAKVTVYGMPCKSIIQRMIMCLFGSLVLTIVLGLPVLGIAYLITK